MTELMPKYCTMQEYLKEKAEQKKAALRNRSEKPKNAAKTQQRRRRSDPEKVDMAYDRMMRTNR